MGNEQDKAPQRWTAKRRAALVVEILRGEILRGDTSAQEAARQHGLTVAEIEQWKEKFLAGAENALRSRPLDEEEMKDHEIKRLKQKIGDLVMDIDILKDTPEQNRVIERFFRSLKEECVWQHNFKSFSEASEKVRGWIRWYNEGRPHQALGYQCPAQYRKQRLLVA